MISIASFQNTMCIYNLANKPVDIFVCVFLHIYTLLKLNTIALLKVFDKLLPSENWEAARKWKASRIFYTL